MGDATSATKAPRKNVVLDYSFMEISSVADLPRFRPEVAGRPLSLVGLPLPPEDGKAEETLDLDGLEPPSRRAEAVRLASNALTGLDGLHDVLSRLVVSPADTVQWLELSCNRISEAADELLNFPRLRTVNLHGNSVSSFREVRKLAALPELRALSLHGNPIEDRKHYRMFVIHTLPRLHKLDFSTITKKDREQARTWAQTYRRQLRGERHEE